MVELIPMTNRDFDAYLEDAIQRYAEANVESGRSHPSEAVERSRADHEQLLPKGIDTPDNFLFSIVERAGRTRVGTLWYSVELSRPVRAAFVYDLLIFEPYRGQGYGRATLLALEEHARRLGVEKIALHVFAGNAVARALYERVGYETTDLVMAKRL